MARLFAIILCLLLPFNETQEYQAPIENLPDYIYDRMPRDEVCVNNPLPSAGDVFTYWFEQGRWDKEYTDTICA